MPKFSDSEQYRYRIGKLKIADTDEQNQGDIASLVRDEREDRETEGLTIKRNKRNQSNQR
jgi:hypothetical protein